MASRSACGRASAGTRSPAGRPRHRRHTRRLARKCRAADGTHDCPHPALCEVIGSTSASSDGLRVCCGSRRLGPRDRSALAVAHATLAEVQAEGGCNGFLCTISTDGRRAQRASCGATDFTQMVKESSRRSVAPRGGGRDPWLPRESQRSVGWATRRHAPRSPAQTINRGRCQWSWMQPPPSVPSFMRKAGGVEPTEGVSAGWRVQH